MMQSVLVLVEYHDARRWYQTKSSILLVYLPLFNPEVMIGAICGAVREARLSSGASAETSHETAGK